MTVLTDTQHEILLAATARPDRLIAPCLPARLRGGARQRVLEGLERNKLVEAGQDGLRANAHAFESLGLPPANPLYPNTKGHALLELMLQENGSSMTEMMKATGWQAHTVRGYLSGTLRKKLGMVISHETDESGERRYHAATGEAA